MPVLDASVDDTLALGRTANNTLPLIRQEPQLSLKLLRVLNFSCLQHLLTITDNSMQYLLLAVNVSLEVLKESIFKWQSKLDLNNLLLNLAKICCFSC